MKFNANQSIKYTNDDMYQLPSIHNRIFAVYGCAYSWSMVEYNMVDVCTDGTSTTIQYMRKKTNKIRTNNVWVWTKNTPATHRKIKDNHFSNHSRIHHIHTLDFGLYVDLLCVYSNMTMTRKKNYLSFTTQINTIDV